MSIRVSCQCGHEFRVKEKYAGSKGKCPGCGTMVQIPGDPPPDTQPAEHRHPHRSSSSERRHIARGLAKVLIPKSLPEIPALEVAAACWPAREPGHDYLDCLQLHDGSWALVLATVNAHGLHAVESSLQLRAATRALALGYSDPGAVLSLLNRTFVADWPEDRSAKMLLLRIEPQSRGLSYASAGHPTAYVLDPQGSVKWNLESTDCTLGLLASTLYGTSSPIRLESGETILILSDGLLQAATTDGAAASVSRLLPTAGANVRMPARAIVEAIQQLFPKDHPPPTDQSLLVVKVR